MDNRAFGLGFFPTIFITGLEHGEEHSKQITAVFKAVVYTTLDLKVKSLVLSLPGSLMSFF